MNKFKWMIRTVLLGCYTLLLINNVYAGAVAYHGIVDFGEKNADLLKAKFRLLSSKSAHDGQVINIIQFGDSHTAADYFTGKLRSLLQSKYGNAGVGWVAPMAVKGQSHAVIKWRTENWQLINCRTVVDRDFPMGGVIAEPTKNPNRIEILFKEPTYFARNWQVTLVYKPLKKNQYIKLTSYDGKTKQVFIGSQLAQWKMKTVKMKMPFTIQVAKGAAELGGLWLQQDKKSGVILSSIATNGAKQSIWQKWSNDWFKELQQSGAQLVILAYGANESFDEKLNTNEYQWGLVRDIRQVRKTLPKATILVLSPPDTMLADKKIGSCSNRRPPKYEEVRLIQQRVAQQEHTLYWDWQSTMGGNCVIKSWLELELARPDLVHLTKEGYEKTASHLYSDLIEYINRD